jgi:hypothetical protein
LTVEPDHLTLTEQEDGILAINVIVDGFASSTRSGLSGSDSSSSGSGRGQLRSGCGSDTSRECGRVRRCRAWSWCIGGSRLCTGTASNDGLCVCIPLLHCSIQFFRAADLARAVVRVACRISGQPEQMWVEVARTSKALLATERVPVQVSVLPLITTASVCLRFWLICVTLLCCLDVLEESIVLGEVGEDVSFL